MSGNTSARIIKSFNVRKRVVSNTMQTYKITFDFELEVDCEEENINDSVLNWIMQNGLYPLYKVQTIGSVNS